MEAENVKRGPGRPTDRKKDTILRLRIDSETHGKLFAYAKKHDVTVSELLRKAVDDIVAREEA